MKKTQNFESIIFLLFRNYSLLSFLYDYIRLTSEAGMLKHSAIFSYNSFILENPETWPV